MKPTLTDKIEIFLKEKEEGGLNISITPSTKLLMGYYVSLGMKPETSMRLWLFGIANGTYPAYSSVTRSIRLCRQRNPRWRKPRTKVTKEVTNTKKEIGYGR